LQSEKKFERERYCVGALAQHLGLPMNNVSNPMCVYKREIGVDVIVMDDERRFGIQVTELDGVEGIAGTRQGQLRAQEKAQQATNPGMYVGNAPDVAIASRIKVKVAKSKRYAFTEVDEVWLLVVANLPDVPGSTFVPKNRINPDVLNRISAAELTGSKYKRAFYQQIMFPALFEWTSHQGWRAVHR
jgi:hypothetical protein